MKKKKKKKTTKRKTQAEKEKMGFLERCLVI